MRPRGVGGVGPLGDDVSVARGTVAQLASRGRAVLSPNSANALPTSVSISPEETSGTGYEHQRSSRGLHHNFLHQGRMNPRSPPFSSFWGPWRTNGEVGAGRCSWKLSRPTPGRCWKCRAGACREQAWLMDSRSGMLCRDEKRAELVAPGRGGPCQRDRDWCRVNKVDAEYEMFGRVKSSS